jgi:hypothetical protein
MATGNIYRHVARRRTDDGPARNVGPKRFKQVQPCSVFPPAASAISTPKCNTSVRLQLWVRLLAANSCWERLACARRFEFALVAGAAFRIPPVSRSLGFLAR